MREQLGKIKEATFGECGYQECMIGLKVTIGGDGWGVGSDIVGGWTTKITERTQWTENDRLIAHGSMCAKVNELLKDAKVSSVDKLVGIPVKCFFDGNMLRKFEILKEVL